jgi:nickel/cobalt exporter
MISDTSLLLGSAAVLGISHTLLGPDHYVPFIALGRARNWSAKRTLLVTTLCGVGHVLSSILIGLAGITLGTKLLKLEAIESFRGEIAAWLLLGFGIAYALWGLRQAYNRRNKPEASAKMSSSAWILFIIFVLGPCEPLIPLLMFPSASINAASLVAVSGVFLICTVGTMLAAVALGYKGVSLFSWRTLQNYSHALAGGAMASCAAMMLFLGL